MSNVKNQAVKWKPNLSFTVLLIIVSALAIGIFIGSIMEYNGLLKERENLEKEIQLAKQKIDLYEHELDADMDDKYIESVAKDKLNLINPDEIIVHSDIDD